MPPITDKQKSDAAPLLQNKSPEAASVSLPTRCCAKRGGKRGLRHSMCRPFVSSIPTAISSASSENPAAPRASMPGPATTPTLYTFHACGPNGRHRRLRRRRAFCRLDRRRTVCLRLPLSAQSDLGRSNQRRRAAAVFRGDRPRAARRGHELSLRRTLRVRRSRRAARRYSRRAL